jgi:hypothetical protein
VAGERYDGSAVLVGALGGLMPDRTGASSTGATRPGRMSVVTT